MGGRALGGESGRPRVAGCIEPTSMERRCGALDVAPACACACIEAGFDARKSAHFCANRASRRVRGMNRSHAFATRPMRLACCAGARAISSAIFSQIEQCQAFQRLVLVLSEAEEVVIERPLRPSESPQSRLCERFQRVRCAHSVDTAKSAD